MAISHVVSISESEMFLPFLFHLELFQPTPACYYMEMLKQHCLVSEDEDSIQCQ